METIIQKVGQQIFHINFKVKKLFCIRVLKNQTTVISFILLMCLPPFLVTFIAWEVRPFHIFLFSSAVVIILFLILLFIGSLHEAKRLKGDRLYSYFQFSRSNLNGIHLTQIGFSESDRDNLNLVLNNLRPKHAIDFRLISDNRIAADYKKLFRILHVLIAGGIKDFKKERKEMLFRFIESTFILNGSRVNRASLNSRFSEFVNESKVEFSSNLSYFQNIITPNYMN